MAGRHEPQGNLPPWPIDPSEDLEQLGILLGKLESAFTPWHIHHDLTSMALLPSKDNAGADGLTISVTCELPGGMPPLVWPVYLSKMTPSHTATALVLPLVEAQYAKRRELESLIDITSQKDAIISKLLDKLEATGTGLDQVFNLPGKRKITRSAAADRIKGLAPFDKQEWKTRLDSGDDRPKDVASLLDAVFGETGLQCTTQMEICDSSELNDWWTKLHKTSGIPIRRQEDKPSNKVATPPAQTIDDSDNDDFQVQATPPHLMSARKPSVPEQLKVEDDASTAGDDDAEIPDSNPVPPPPKASRSSKPSSKLGAIGRNKRPLPARSPEPEPPAPADDDTETASEADDEPQPALPPQPPSPPPPPTKASPKKVGLGRIGGVKPKISAQRNSSPTSDQGSSTSGPPPPPHPKLGTIGKKGPANVKAEAEDGPRGRARVATKMDEDVEEGPRETSQERADRKRAELQKELEKKAAAGPSKKKRRF
jgi:hypothetical protein